MSRRIIVVAGNLGVGKTTLVELLGRKLNWHAAHEAVADNPYLTDYYADMCAWAFHLQFFFLGNRCRQHLEAGTVDGTVIMDRSIYEDANVFALALHETGKISHRDYTSYRAVFDFAAAVLPKPDLLVYLTAPVKVLMERIRRRGLGFDYRGIDETYLAMIDSYYRQWVSTIEMCPVLTLDTQQHNYVNDGDCLSRIALQIQERIGT